MSIMLWKDRVQHRILGIWFPGSGLRIHSISLWIRSMNTRSPDVEEMNVGNPDHIP